MNETGPILDRSWFTAQLLRSGVEVARPERDTGIDLLAYTSSTTRMLPIQLNGHSENVLAMGTDLLHSVFDQADAESVTAQYDRMLDALAEKLPKVHDHLDGARTDVLAFTGFPKELWRQVWSNNPISVNRLSGDTISLVA